MDEAELRSALPEEDDYDLLTYDEVGVRLKLEIQQAREQVEAAPPAERAAATARLEALIEASERNGRRQVNDENFERFFGFANPRKSD